jgi:hypothetical protein
LALVVQAKPQLTGLEVHLNRALLYPRQSPECFPHPVRSAARSGQARNVRDHVRGGRRAVRLAAAGRERPQGEARQDGSKQ